MPQDQGHRAADPAIAVAGGETVGLTGADEAGAPQLRYDMPASTEFEYVVFVPLNVAPGKFRPIPDETEPASRTPAYHTAITTAVGHGLGLGAAAKVSLVVDPREPIWNPGDLTLGAVGKAGLPQAGIEEREARRERRPSGGGAGGTDPSAIERLVLDTGSIPRQASLRKTFYGALRNTLLAVEPKRQQLFIAERYRVASYLGDFGATSVVSTVTLLPGEKTTITLSQSVNDTVNRSITTNILDSYNEQSANEFEAQLNDQKSLGLNQTDQAGDVDVASEATSLSASLSVSGSASIGVAKGSSSLAATGSHQSSDTDTASHNHVRQDSAQTVRSALDHHVNQSSSARSYQSSTGTQQQDTLTTNQSNVTVRQIENINRGRVLNFVIRQLSQEYHSVTYLHDVQFVYFGPDVADKVVATLASLNQMLGLVLVDDGADGAGNETSARREVLAQIVHSLSNVTDVSGQPVSLIRHFDPPDDVTLLEGSGLKPFLKTKADDLPRFARNGRAFFANAQAQGADTLPKLGEASAPITVDGIVVDVARRILKTNALVADALLGRSTALDDYNARLQGAAAQKQELANRQVETALDVVAQAPDDPSRAKAFQQVFGLETPRPPQG